MKTSTPTSFTIVQILKEAWTHVHGSKGALWIPTICIGAVSAVVQLLIEIIFRLPSPALFRFLIIPIISNMAAAPFIGGAIMTAIDRVRGHPIDSRSGFKYFHKSWDLMAVLVVMTIGANFITYLTQAEWINYPASITGWLNFIALLISIIVYVLLILAVPLTIDKNLPPKKALSGSYRIVKPYFFKALILFIIACLLFFVASAPLVIGGMIHPYLRWFGLGILIAALVWLVPFFLLLEGVFYHRLVDSPL